MDHKFISQLIEDLNIALGFHSDSINNIHTECQCESVIGKCDRCLMKENLMNLSESIKILNEFTPNTSHILQLIEAEAFRYALYQSGYFTSIHCYPIFNDPTSELNYPDVEADSFAIDATIERYAMDGNGYHVGYEQVTIQWKAINKTDFELHGIPRLLSNWVINPNQYEIVDRNYPDEIIPTKDDHDDDCEFKDTDDFSNCDCADCFEGYYHPDDYFWYDNIQSSISQLKYPDAHFDSEQRQWTLGEISFNLNDYENDPEYKNDCNIESGAPLH